MTARCITPRRRSRPLALHATPIIAERFAWRPRATPIARSAMPTWKRAEAPPFLQKTSTALKAIIPNLPRCGRIAATRELFSSITMSTCSQIYWDRMAAACKWFAPIATARPPMAAARGHMEIQKARRAPRKLCPRMAAKPIERGRVFASLHGASNVRADLRCLPFAAI